MSEPRNAAKVAYFAGSIEREVAARKQRTKHQLALDLGKKAAEKIEAAEKKSTAQIEATRREINRDTNEKLSAATKRAKAAYFATRNSLQAQLLEDVAQDLGAFANSPEYENYLAERITKAKAKFPSATAVKLRPQDMHFSQKIQDVTALTPLPLPAETNCIGGFILQNENGKIRADYTFETRLSEVSND
ncbi:MAG: V-type ATP synthase subunit E [Defluviitaleaceae bacterium]|nr:V-type ATP synthase subunit E [Defluviitaleaceae bacterium]MCL2263823.1 V-type ATP synthase subunit E [Defluviitaleaceae bacterium]